jgi:metal-responsive CopG/Arc/MetJ family transcriptional regulator
MSGRTAKLAVTVPEELSAFTNRVARECGTSRSKLVATCLQEMAERRLRAEMEEGYRALTGELKETAALAREAQRRVLPEWE